MKLTITLKDGTTDFAYVSDDIRNMLVGQIMDESCYDDTSEIDDRDYIDYAIMMNDELRIFKKKYNSDDVMEYEVDHDAQESEEERKNRLLSYLAVYPDALAYAEGFFSFVARSVFEMQADGKHAINGNVLPITFITDGWVGGRLNGRFSVHGSQAVIHVLLQDVELSEKLKEEIRHEICHYILWLTGLPHDDATPEFWALSTVFKGGPYELMKASDAKYFKAFAEFYHGTVESLMEDCPWIVNPYIGSAIAGMKKCKTLKAYQESLAEIKQNINVNKDIIKAFGAYSKGI